MYIILNTFVLLPMEVYGMEYEFDSNAISSKHNGLKNEKLKSRVPTGQLWKI